MAITKGNISDEKRTVVLESHQETEAFAENCAPLLKGKIIFLQGELGVGKTTFVRGLARGLGIFSRIQSPTFTYQRVYSAKGGKLYHFDCYRMAEPEHLFLHDVYEAIAAKNSTVVIEWPQIIAPHFAEKAVVISFEYTGENSRELIITNRFTQYDKPRRN